MGCATREDAHRQLFRAEERKEADAGRVEVEAMRTDAQRHGDLIAGMGSEQRSRDRAVLNVFHPGTVPPGGRAPTNAAVDFDGGAKPAASRAASPAPTTWPSPEAGARSEAEVEDGAALLFP